MSGTLLAPPAHKKKAELAYEFLRERILSGWFKPGQRLTLAGLAGELGLSQMPVREAVLRLEQDGLIRTTPHRDMTVAELSVEDARHIFPIRATLEGLAARLAFDRLDAHALAEMERANARMAAALERGDFEAMPDANWSFHRVVLRAAANPLLARMVEDIWARSSRFRLGYRLIPGRARNTLAEHGRILAALRARDRDALVAAAQDHVERAGSDLVRELTASKG